jgi:hypothetical protein
MNRLIQLLMPQSQPLQLANPLTFVSAVVDADDAPDSESADDLEDENSELIEKYNYIAW